MTMLRILIVDDEELARRRLVRLLADLPGVELAGECDGGQAALVRLREANDLYRLDDGAVLLAEQTLFRADVRLPANLIEGFYATRIFLVRDGKVIDTFRAPIEVRKVGLERWLYRLALHQPFVYGFMSLAIAVFAGWGASAAFRQLRRT